MKGDLDRTDGIMLDLQQENESLHQRLQNLESTNNRLIEEFLKKISSKEEELEDVKRNRLREIEEIECLTRKLEVNGREIDKRKELHSDLSLKFNQLIDENEKLIDIGRKL